MTLWLLARYLTSGGLIVASLSLTGVQAQVVDTGQDFISSIIAGPNASNLLVPVLLLGLSDATHFRS